MPNTTATYDLAKVERLKHLLSSLQEKGKAKFYEIFVDNLKVVEKTEDATEFETYMDYLDNDTQEVKVVIYNSGNSPRNDQYTFELKPKEKDRERYKEKPLQQQAAPSLSGLDIENRIDEKLQIERRKWEMELLRKENEDLKVKIQDAEEFMDQLQQAYEEEKAKKQKLGNVDLGDLASVAFEGLIRRNTHLISKIPGGEALAGIIEEDNREKMKTIAAPQEETEASFKKADTASIINKEDEERLQVLRMMQQNFNEVQLKEVWSILQKLSMDNSLISPVLDLLESPQEKEQNNNQSNQKGDEEV
jgi:hypothetical protein